MSDFPVPPEIEHGYLAATQKTAANLRTIAEAPQFRQLSHLTLPQIQEISDQIARVVPAGNMPGLILSGLSRIEERQVPQAEAERHIGLLFRGVRDMLDKAMYGAMFAGPAAVIMAYQRLLQLAGKDLDAAFPEGTWQFYLEFGLREDSARHANETSGFHDMLRAYQLSMTQADQLAAWVMASLVTLHNFDRLIENEWRERMLLNLLAAVVAEAGAPNEDAIKTAYSSWEKIRPYARSRDAGSADYPAYRRGQFDLFLNDLLRPLSAKARADYDEAVQKAQSTALPAYIRQMRILAALEPDAQRERRVPFDLAEAHIGIIYRGRYWLVPVDGGGGSLPNVHHIRSVVARILAAPADGQGGDLDLLLVNKPRGAQPMLRAKANATANLHALARTPILINADQQVERAPLAQIRQGRRGIGDHALTIFFTPESTVFDQSHIFFDGAWGVALAEIMTNEALSWVLYLRQLAPATPSSKLPATLNLNIKEEARRAAETLPSQSEAFAENTAVRFSSVQTLRRLFKARSDLFTVTVNDLLVLYRTLHGQRYVPSPVLLSQVEALKQDANPVSQSLYIAIRDSVERLQKHNPSLLIPMNANHGDPRERLYPSTFRNPFPTMLAQHDKALETLRAYQQAGAGSDRNPQFQSFDEAQRGYLSMVASFGLLMSRYKEVALSGESLSTVSIKMLAHMPEAVQKLLDQIPGRFDILNEIIKGEEVFSNVGRVARGSSLRRFITAKDDNDQKALAWGVMTDDRDTMHISLRDFRPHVALLYQHGLHTLGQQITQDFLDSYVQGFNVFIRELREITAASRESRIRKP